MKAVMISIRPKWVEKIASGEKTVEVRKTAPKLEVPFKVYMYCTYGNERENYYLGKRGKVVGEFVCDKIEHFDSKWSEWAYAVAPSGSIMPMHADTAIKLCETKGAMTLYDIIAYFGDEEWKAHFLHISYLKIYDKPKELSEFVQMCSGLCADPAKGYVCPSYYKEKRLIDCKHKKIVQRPPMSWCYVEEL